MSEAELLQTFSRRLTILGCTGSIGLSTLDIVRHVRGTHGADAFAIEALTANSNVALLAELAREFRPRLAVIGEQSRFAELKDALSGSGIEIAAGRDAVIAAAAGPAELVMLAIVGTAGLAPALAAVARGATLALANKECVVAAGEIFRAAVSASRARIVPVDSEHNAAFQILDLAQSHAVERLTLTASGGPFRQWELSRMAKATPEQAVSHPNWSMGAKISVDSATLMNKGLELIEAHVLFALEPEQLAAVVHPQSIVHCLVTYSDGATLAHMSAPDMRTPIAYALGWPRRISSPARRLDLATLAALTFEAPDLRRFPCLKLAQDCLRAGGHAPTILNAANEIAVEAFLNRRIGFLDISRVVEETLAGQAGSGEMSLDSILETDRFARNFAGNLCRGLAA